MKTLRKSIVNLYKTLPLVSILIFLSISTTPISHASPSSTPLVYVDMPTKTGTTGETFTATIFAKDFSNLYTWQVGLTWNPVVLNVTTFYGGPGLTDGVFSVLAPGRTTLWMQGGLDNTAGRLYYSAESLTGAGGVTGTAGTDYKLMKVDFEFTASGTSDLHLRDVMLIDDTSDHMSINIIDHYTAIWDEIGYPNIILTNSTGRTGTKLHSHAFNPDMKQLSFNVTSKAERRHGGMMVDTKGFCNVTISKNFMWVDTLSDWGVTVNGAPPLASPDIKEDDTSYYVYFTYNHTDGELQIQILSKYFVPEFPAILIPLLLMVLTLLGAIFGKRFWSRKRQRAYPCQVEHGTQ